MTDVFACVSWTAWATVLNTGTVFSNRWPPFPGVTPATTLVPYSIICLAWNDPSRPLLHCFVHVGKRLESCALENRDPFLLIRAGQPDHDRHLERKLFRGLHDAIR